MWSGNSPDLSPIENIWAIVQRELDRQEPATFDKALISSPQRAWSNMSTETWDNPVLGMPKRTRESLRLGRACIGK